MSEQVVKRYWINGSDWDVDEEQDGEWVGFDDYDALHAEAEALRAENGRLTREAKNDAIAYKAVIERQEQLREERDSFQREGIRAMEELEAARGLLRDIAPFFAAPHGRDDLHHRLDAFLTATQEPEVRQEALCMGCVDQASRIRELEHKMDYYTSLTLAQDVSGLVRAGAQMANGCFNLSQDGCEVGDHKVALRSLAKAWDAALAAHRQAQRQA